MFELGERQAARYVAVLASFIPFIGDEAAAATRSESLQALSRFGFGEDVDEVSEARLEAKLQEQQAREEVAEEQAEAFFKRMNPETAGTES